MEKDPPPPSSPKQNLCGMLHKKWVMCMHALTLLLQNEMSGGHNYIVQGPVPHASTSKSKLVCYRARGWTHYTNIVTRCRYETHCQGDRLHTRDQDLMLHASPNNIGGVSSLATIIMWAAPIEKEKNHSLFSAQSSILHTTSFILK